MIEADVLEFVGYCFAAYATGWGSGYLLYVFRRALDFV